MNSVISTSTCPRCAGEAYTEFYYNSGEEETSCMFCGYRYQGRYQRDENGKLVTADGTNDYRFENLIWTEKKVEPYACFHLKFKKRRATQCGSLENEEAIAAFKSEVDERMKEIERAFISRYDEEKKEVLVEELVMVVDRKR